MKRKAGSLAAAGTGTVGTEILANDTPVSIRPRAVKSSDMNAERAMKNKLNDLH